MYLIRRCRVSGPTRTAKSRSPSSSHTRVNNEDTPSPQRATIETLPASDRVHPSSQSSLLVRITPHRRVVCEGAPLHLLCCQQKNQQPARPSSRRSASAHWPRRRSRVRASLHSLRRVGSHSCGRDAADGTVFLLRILLAHGLQVVGRCILVQRVHLAHAGENSGLGVARVVDQVLGLRGRDGAKGGGHIQNCGKWRRAPVPGAAPAPRAAGPWS